jgi:hypothetical protein
MDTDHPWIGGRVDDLGVGNTADWKLAVLSK